MSNKGYKVSAEDRVRVHLEEVQIFFKEEEFEIIKEGYAFIKPLLVEQDYMELAAELITSVLSRRKEGEAITFDTVTADAVRNLGINKGLQEKVTLTGLKNDKTATYDDEESLDKALESTIDKLLDSTDLKNAVFLDIAVRGKTREEVAKKYRISVQNVSVLYEAARETVEDIMVIDHDVLVKDVESREPYTSNVKKLTDPRTKK